MSSHADKEAAHHRATLQGFIPIFEDDSLPLCAFPAEKYQELVDSNEYRTVKLVHFVRHGNGIHNKRAEDSGHNCLCTDTPNPLCPYVSRDLLDSVLTPQGEAEAEEVFKFLENHPDIQVELILTSPLSRAIQTCIIGMKAARFNATPRASWENLREQSGMHACDERNTKTWLEREYGSYGFDFSDLEEADTLFSPNAREERAHLGNRILLFLDKMSHHKASHFAAFTHSSYLFTMSGAWFQTGELRSYAIAFKK